MGELGSLKNGMNFSKEAMGIGFPFVNLQNIFGNNVIDVTNLGKAMASDSQLKDYNLLNGDVLFVRSSVKLEGVGEAALVPQNLENTTYSGFIIRFRDEYGLDNNFKRFLFGIESVRNQIMAQATNSANKNISQTVLENLCLKIPNKSEQEKIGLYFSNLDHLITLHHRKYMKYADLSVFDWEQRKFADFTWDAGKRNKEDLDLEPYAITNEHGFIRQRDAHDDFGYMKDTDRKAYNIVQPNSFAYNPARINVGSIGYYKGVENVIVSSLYEVFQTDTYVNDRFLWHWLKSDEFPRWIEKLQEGSVRLYFYYDKLCECQLYMPSLEEQEKIATFLDDLDHLITLHHRKQNYVLNTLIYAKTTLFITKEKKKMPELEKVIEDKLIEQLVFGESQWTYREDLKTEEELWQNFRYILEQNNKARLDGQPLSDAEFEQVKNQLQFSSFYKAGEWLVGENGKAMVHVQRDTEKLHLVVMNHEHIAGGSSVYEVINQYNALKDDDITTVTRDRRFDVTLMINGLPMIHIELKNRQHSYMEAFYQIKKYISEGKFTGIFSAVQMFVISNGVDTKYFAAASDTELNPKFMSGWVDTENNPVADYIDFAKNVLRIPEAHEMIARYTVLDEDAKRLILLRPYQIHAIESIREAYDKYAGVYKNAVEEIKIAEGGDDSGNEPPEDETIDVDYELMAYSSTKIDYEYIINLIQNIVTPDEDAEAISPEERQKQIDEVKQYIDEMRKDNPKVAEIMTNLVSEIEEDENKYKGQSILNIVENMKRDCIEKVISDFCVTWYASKEDVMYAALHYRNGEIPNESVIKATIDYQSYKSVQEKALPKFKYYAKCMAELKKTLDEEIKPLISVA